MLTWMTIRARDAPPQSDELSPEPPPPEPSPRPPPAAAAKLPASTDLLAGLQGDSPVPPLLPPAAPASAASLPPPAAVSAVPALPLLLLLLLLLLCPYRPGWTVLLLLAAAVLSVCKKQGHRDVSCCHSPNKVTFPRERERTTNTETGGGGTFLQCIKGVTPRLLVGSQREARAAN